MALDLKTIEKDLLDRGFVIGAFNKNFCEYEKGFVVVTGRWDKQIIEVGVFKPEDIGNGFTDTYAPGTYIPMKNIKNLDDIDVLCKFVND